MNAQNILQQEEIDALINSVESGDIETEEGHQPKASEAYSYDLCAQERIVRGKMPTLDMINERFARHFKLSLNNLFHRAINVTTSVVETVKFSEYTHALDFPSNINFIKIKPFKGMSLIVIAPELLFTMVDNYFGGSGRFSSISKDREFSAIEMRIVNIILQQIFIDYKKAWEPVFQMDMEYVKSEVNPHFANIVTPSEVVIVSAFSIEIEGVKGTLHITIPYSMLEPVRELLATGVQSDRVELNENWTRSLQEELSEVRLELACSVTETTVNLRELMSISAGDIIMVDLPDAVTAKLENIPVYKCTYGISHGHNSLKIIEPYMITSG